jgi:hypothetical protein
MNHFANFNGDDLLKDIRVFLIYSNYTALPLGILLNSLSIVICTRKNRSKNTTTWFYYNVVSITNVLILVEVFVVFYYLSLGLAVTSISNFSCKLVTYTSRVLTQFSSWLNVVITYDHIWLISQPQKYKTLTQSKKYIGLVLAGLLLVLCAANFMNLEFGLVDLPEPTITTQAPTTLLGEIKDIILNTTTTQAPPPKYTKGCTSKSTGDVFIRDMIALVMRSLLPFVLMFFGNIVLVYKFHRSKKTSQANNTSPKKELDFIIVIVVLNLVFFGLTLPNAVAELTLQNYGPRSLFTPTSIEMANVQLAYIITTNVSFYNHVVTFFVNLRFNALFFIEFKVLFCMRGF